VPTISNHPETSVQLLGYVRSGFYLLVAGTGEECTRASQSGLYVVAREAESYPYGLYTPVATVPQSLFSGSAGVPSFEGFTIQDGPLRGSQLRHYYRSGNDVWGLWTPALPGGQEQQEPVGIFRASQYDYWRNGEGGIVVSIS